MGEASRRGVRDQRVAEAKKAARQKAAQELFGGSLHEYDEALRSVLTALISQVGEEAWVERRRAIVLSLQELTASAPSLAEAKPIRIRDDEIAWYMLLAELALEDPLCLEVSQAARALPFLTGIGLNWTSAERIAGLPEKLSELVGAYKSDPDGLIFELLVAFAYAAQGWLVEFIETIPPAKSPDFKATKDGRVLFVECKRLNRRSSYSETETASFLRLWEGCPAVLLEKKQWVWLRATFRKEPDDFADDFLVRTLAAELPLERESGTLLDTDEMLLEAKQIDVRRVQDHLKDFRVKLNSPTLTTLLGGDWAPLNSATTVAQKIRTSSVGCDVPILGTYVDEMAWASGVTRHFVSEASIEKKARDVRTRLSNAVDQVPADADSVIHIAVETLEGRDVDQRRAEKIRRSIETFTTEKPVQAVRVHFFQANECTEKLWEFDETIMHFDREGFDRSSIPWQVILPSSDALRTGAHWELYP